MRPLRYLSDGHALGLLAAGRWAGITESQLFGEREQRTRHDKVYPMHVCLHRLGQPICVKSHDKPNNLGPMRSKTRRLTKRTVFENCSSALVWERTCDPNRSQQISKDDNTQDCQDCQHMRTHIARQSSFAIHAIHNINAT
jgi:hypothetical protein